MSETPTGTDRVELTDAEFATVPHLSQLDSYADARDIKKAVERLLAARVQALTAERDELQARLNGRGASQEFVMRFSEAEFERLSAEREAARAELAAANARAIDFEQRTEAWHHRADMLQTENAALQATLDRVTAVLDEWKLCLRDPKRRRGWSGGAVLAELRAALTPEGTE